MLMTAFGVVLLITKKEVLAIGIEDVIVIK